MYDLVIIGGAAAGSAAAVYAARRNLHFIVIAKDLGGEVALCGEVENWPGQIHTTGVQLAADFSAHMRSYNPNIQEGYLVSGIRQEKNYHIVTAKNYAGEEKEYTTKAVLIATGIHPRPLGVPGEDALRGRGVTYCTVCDGPLYKNKITTTIGAGNSALESALMMAEIASKVYVITKFPNTPETKGGFPKGENVLIDKMKQKENVEIIYNANTLEIVGDTVVKQVVYEDKATKEKHTLDTHGVMIHVGMVPNSQFLTNINKTSAGEIVVDTACKTSIPGIFAAGDVTSTPFKQIVIAAGMGVTASLSAIDYINRW